VAKYLHDVIKSPDNKFWLRSQIAKRIPDYAVNYVDPAFQSDFLLPIRPWKSITIRPKTQYEYRVVKAFLNPGLDWFEDFFEKIKDNTVFTFGLKFRPRILTTISDGALIANLVSTRALRSTLLNNTVRYKELPKYKLNTEQVVQSVLRMCSIFQNSNVTVIPPRAALKINKVSKTDFIYLDMKHISGYVIKGYYDVLSLKGYTVMLTGKLRDEQLYLVKEYNIEEFNSPRGAHAYIIRNYRL